MGKYKVNFYTGDYSARQRAANKDGCDLYVEHHFNSVINRSASYTHVKVASNASTKSMAIGRTYAAKCSQAFKVAKGFGDGVDKGGRGNGNLKYTDMPAILLEPLFVSNPEQAAIVKSKEGQHQLAVILVETIIEHFPEGGLVAFSVGHKGKTSKPRDMGADVYGGGNEATYAEIVLDIAAALLEKKSVKPEIDPCEVDNTTLIYEVQPGEGLYGIGKKFGKSVKWLKDKNGLKGDSLDIGQKLIVKE